MTATETKPADTEADREKRWLETRPYMLELRKLEVDALRAVIIRAGELSRAKEAHKEAEAHVVTIHAQISRAIDEAENPAPLYDAPPMPNGDMHAEVIDESWRAFPIAEALPGLGKKVYEGMERAQLRTFGELIDWKNASDSRWWTDLDGVGKGAATKIDDAIEAFFTEWAKRQPAPAPAADVQDAEFEVKRLPAPKDDAVTKKGKANSKKKKGRSQWW